ncbi:MAG: LytTR family DNA-binding domain-containing protein [Lachnospiraceae bacterium]|jgi:DNA-binding LytR/AlgR family response regulator|nr:response regulator transcription factor [Lachnospiraceae bacterium]MCR4696322.1 LytTR family DNA-binding domain-containing protein [Lachnospiraceae bacterium]
MFKIAICDDEMTSLMINRALTEQVLEEEHIEYQITTFEDMYTMMKGVLDDNSDFDLLLSDILAVGMNGIEAAEEIRRLGDKLPIVFISSTAEYALDGYRVNALRYLQKPVQIDKLREALLEAYSNIGKKRTEYLSFQVADKFYKVNYDDIIYLESMGRDTYVVTKTESITVHAKFSDMENKLPSDRFVRCHRSYIINMSEVKDIARYRFLTKGGVEIPISQLQYADVKQSFIDFEG